MSKRNLNTLVCILAVSCLVAFGANASNGGVLTLRLDYAFNGTGPGGAAPWATAVFDDQAHPGYVTMTLTATDLQPTESIEEWYLNIDPAIVPSSLGFTLLSTTGTFDTTQLKVNTGADDAYKADGDGYYDIKVAFPHTDGADTRFTSGDSVTYKISGVSLAEEFNFFSTPGPGNASGPFKMAAHIQGTANGSSSGWVGPALPEPSSLVLGGIAVAVLCSYYCRQRSISL
jgi:hypothetical protein